MILQTDQLNRSQLSQLNELYEICQKADAGSPAIYRHLLIEKRPSNNTILYYKNEQLIGFLSVYFFYNEGCEISLLVHPNYRRQKIAAQLLRQISPLLIVKSIQNVIFSTPPSLTWLPTRGFSYLESEYHMERIGTLPASLTTSALTISHADMNDIAALVEMDHLCFSSGSSPPQHFTYLLNNPHYTILVASHQNRPVGKAHIRWQDDSITFLSDIAILPSFQGQGFGYELLAHTIRHVLSQGKTKLALDVTTNQQSKAFNLYSRHGFKTTLQYDYWAISLEKLQSLIEAATCS